MTKWNMITPPRESSRSVEFTLLFLMFVEKFAKSTIDSYGTLEIKEKASTAAPITNAGEGEHEDHAVAKPELIVENADSSATNASATADATRDGAAGRRCSIQLLVDCAAFVLYWCRGSSQS